MKKLFLLAAISLFSIFSKGFAADIFSSAEANSEKEAKERAFSDLVSQIAVASYREKTAETRTFRTEGGRTAESGRLTDETSRDLAAKNIFGAETKVKRKGGVFEAECRISAKNLPLYKKRLAELAAEGDALCAALRESDDGVGFRPLLARSEELLGEFDFVSQATLMLSDYSAQIPRCNLTAAFLQKIRSQESAAVSIFVEGDEDGEIFACLAKVLAEKGFKIAGGGCEIRARAQFSPVSGDEKSYCRWRFSLNFFDKKGEIVFSYEASGRDAPRSFESGFEAAKFMAGKSLSKKIASEFSEKFDEFLASR